MSKLKPEEVREWISSKNKKRGKKEGNEHYYTHTVTGFEASYAIDILYEEIERLREELMKVECSELRRVPYRSEGDYTCRNACQHSRKNGDYCKSVLDAVNKEESNE